MENMKVAIPITASETDLPKERRAPPGRSAVTMLITIPKLAIVAVTKASITKPPMMTAIARMMNEDGIKVPTAATMLPLGASAYTHASSLHSFTFFLMSSVYP